MGTTGWQLYYYTCNFKQLILCKIPAQLGLCMYAKFSRLLLTFIPVKLTYDRLTFSATNRLISPIRMHIFGYSGHIYL